MMRCPITYDNLLPGENHYSGEGLKWLSPRLHNLLDFPYTVGDQLEEAKRLASKLSIQGVQPKLSVILDVPKESFIIAERGGTFILKPQNPQWENLPENEDLTMRLAALIGIEVPLHGMLYCKDGALSYWIRRFDRPSVRNPLKQKLNVEDFAQLSQEDRQTKYNSTMEKVAKIIDLYCTFPVIEKEKLFRLTIFNFIVGNEDMHLKNFSLITRGEMISLSPAYDLLNTTLVMGKGVQEEIALTLNGKKHKLKVEDFVEVYGKERLGLNTSTINRILQKIQEIQPQWMNLIDRSFLSNVQKEGYRAIITERLGRIFPRNLELK